MMAYLTRPGFRDGTSLEKDFPNMSNTEIIETTEQQKTLVPPQKPQEGRTLAEEMEFIKKIDQTNPSPQLKLLVRQKALERALKKGLITQEDFNKAVQPLFGETGEKITKSIEEYEEMVEKDATNK